MRFLAACFFLILYTVTTATSALAEKRVALVIGNSKYQHSSRLKNPGNDAREVAASFKRLGFSQVVLKYDLDVVTFLRTLASFSRTASGADLAVIYYSGHGIEVDGQNYMIPIDAKLNHSSDIEYEATSLRKVMTALERAGNFRLVILDACRDNPFRSRMLRSGSTRSVGKGLAPVAPGRNTLIAYAAKDGTVAYDGETNHSPYTSSLLRFMEEPGVEIGYLFRLVRDGVLSATTNRQEPFTYGSLGSDRIYLKPGKPAVASRQDKSLRVRIKQLEAQIRKQKVPSQPNSVDTEVVDNSDEPFGDPIRGKKVFKKCAACHMVGEGARHKIGPILNNVVGRKAASLVGYKYSKPMLYKSENGLIWTPENIAQFLRKPRAFVGKTTMAFAGLKKDRDRYDVIAYLARFSSKKPDHFGVVSKGISNPDTIEPIE